MELICDFKIFLTGQCGFLQHVLVFVYPQVNEQELVCYRLVRILPFVTSPSKDRHISHQFGSVLLMSTKDRCNTINCKVPECGEWMQLVIRELADVTYREYYWVLEFTSYILEVRFNLRAAKKARCLHNSS